MTVDFINVGKNTRTVSGRGYSVSFTFKGLTVVPRLEDHPGWTPGVTFLVLVLTPQISLCRRPATSKNTEADAAAV